MTVHQRIRRFNTRDTYPEQRLDNDLCQVVVARGTTVFVRGQVGQHLDLEVRRQAAEVGRGGGGVGVGVGVGTISSILLESSPVC